VSPEPSLVADSAAGGQVPAAALERLVRVAQAERRSPSVVAAVVHGRDVVWSTAVGIAAPGSGGDAGADRAAATPTTAPTPATVDHAYRVGSITKTFTAVAILQLRDQGALDLDDRLEQHLAVPAHRGPTIRRLLAHLSGLQREPPGAIWQSLVDHDEQELLARLPEAEQALPPGQRFHYSNLAFALLGQVVARRAGAPYETVVRERLLEPLGLARTSFDPTAPHAQGLYVRPWEDAVDPEPHVRLVATAAAAQLWSTAADLCAWGAFLADPDPAVLAPGTAEELRVPQTISDEAAWLRGFGLGVILYRRGERIYVGHGGAMPGFLAEVVYAPKDRVGAVVLVNTTAGFDTQALALDLAEKAAEALAGPDEWRPGRTAPAALRSVLGSWWLEGAELTFRWRDDALEAQPVGAALGRFVSRFAPEGDDLYRVAAGRERGELLRLHRGPEGAVESMTWATYAVTRQPQSFVAAGDET
jgi:CubicO group peptidase (beta-lactamase class C family)